MSQVTPIFLLSLPRSGSTYLQTLLGGHNAIATTSEPWVLLPLLYACRRSGTWAEYDHEMQTKALMDVAQRLPGGKDDLDEVVHACATDFYGRLSGAAPFFLDKTPRYHLIVNDLFRLFPEARFVFLWRNPLSVAASMLDAWGTGKWNLGYWEIDLYRGLSALLRAERDHQDRLCAVRYEDLIREPDLVLARVFDYLGLDPKQLSDPPDLRGRLGDPTARAGVPPPVDPLDRWRRTMSNPARKRWSVTYLEWIGEQRLHQMGYDLGELLKSVESLPDTSRHLASDLLLRARSRAAARIRSRLVN